MSKVIYLSNGQKIAIDNVDVNLPSSLIDAFARLRVSSPVIQTSINQSSRLRDLTLSEGQLSGSGTSSSYNSDRASTTLSVGTAVGLRRLRSNICGLYQPGKSLLIFFTFVFGQGQDNVKKRVGYFDPNDGIFLQQNGNSIEWVKRSRVSGTVVETVVPQSAWTEKFDGTGTGYNFDPTKAHIGFISVEWLGVGEVTCGFIQNQRPVVAYTFTHPNNINSVYMRTANLFLTFEIEKTVAGGTSASFETICGSIISEGSTDKTGYSFAINRTSSYLYTTAFSVRPIICFRLNPNYINARVIPLFAQAIVSTNTNFYIHLLRNPSYLSGSPSWSNFPNFSLQYDIDLPTTMSVSNAPSCIVWTWMGNTNQEVSIGGTDLLNYLGSNYWGTPDEWALAVQCDSSNETVNLASIKFMEMI